VNELGHELRAVPIVYRDEPLRSRYYVDMIVDNTVVVEVKAVAALAEIHKRQVITHLKLTGLPVGLLMNFNVVKLTDGLRRVVNPDCAAEKTER
jgi:GxxExxY protein